MAGPLASIWSVVLRPHLLSSTHTGCRKRAGAAGGHGRGHAQWIDGHPIWSQATGEEQPIDPSILPVPGSMTWKWLVLTIHGHSLAGTGGTVLLASCYQHRQGLSVLGVLIPLIIIIIYSSSTGVLPGDRFFFKKKEQEYICIVLFG
jgi:hypothetical protein